MNDFNPYASPEYIEPVQAQFVQASNAGLWRQGNLLVMHKQAPLPDRCVKSNQPANRRLKRKLYWHHPAVYLVILAHILIYAIVAFIVRKKATIHIPLSDAWFAKRRHRIVMAWGSMLLSIVGCVAGGIFIDQYQSPCVFLIVGGVVTFLVSALGGLYGARMVYPKRIDDTHVWLGGVCPEYLAGLPELPTG